MNTFLTFATWFVGIGGVILIGILIFKSYANNITQLKGQVFLLKLQKFSLTWRPSFLKKSWWVSDFPDYYHPKCFDCNLGPESCEDCQYCTWGKKEEIHANC